jgi:hypothetical protein
MTESLTSRVRCPPPKSDLVFQWPFYLAKRQFSSLSRYRLHIGDDPLELTGVVNPLLMPHAVPLQRYSDD